MKISQKLTLSFSIVFIIVVIMISILYWILRELEWHRRRIDYSYSQLVQLEKLNSAITRQMYELLDVLFVEGESKDEYLLYGEKFLESLDNLKKLTKEKMIFVPEEEKAKEKYLTANLRNMYKDLLKSSKEIIRLKEEGKNEEALRKFTVNIEEGFDNFFAKNMEAIINLKNNEINDIQQSNERISYFSKILSWSIILFTLIFIIVISILITRSITNPIKKLKDAMFKVGKGKLQSKIEVKTKDEIGVLSASFNKMVNDLQESTDALKESEGKHRKLIETAQDAIISIDEKGIINVWNESAESIFGYTKSEIIGKPVTIIMPENYDEKHQEGFGQFLKTGESNVNNKIVELKGWTKKGIEIPIEMSSSSQKMGKERYTFTAIIRDITFQKEAKKQLIEKTKEIEKLTKELKDFVYIISIDLKEPLFAIDGYTSKLSKTYEKMFDENGKSYIDRIKANTETMSKKVCDIIEFLKIGKVTCNFTNNDSEAIVNDVIKSLEWKIKSSKIKVLIQDKLPNILCDREKLKEVFYNLVINTIKFMGDDDQRLVKIGCHKDEHYYKFFVEDTGIGIRGEYHEEVFKVFRRLKDIEAKGTGIGLAIVKKIVELHNGKVWVESPVKDGIGTRVCFTMPIK